MKHMKTILIALIAVATLAACKSDDDNNEVPFIFNNANLAGTHDLTFLRVDAEVRDQVAGVPVTAIVTGIGDTFQTTVDFSASGNFVIDGEFRVATEVTINGSTETDQVIVDLNNESGTYVIGSNAQTITFSGIEPVQFDEDITVDLIDGTWEVALFNESELRLTKMEREIDGDTETDTTVEIRFVRQ